ncbi:DUF5819 family protein [Bacillus mycoides]|nr:DUF5819 family protein [Bacillus mycoides]MED1270808.1 DUF5819 family protein [Bacillus mycoides]OFD35969.1 hypothetical protein BWGOE3_57380 [Bacillus mycoides]OFD36196.1 hypothetical protein BWGOE2_55340 [Bacillus mycoides]OFD52983.1 hypothetical protein BWGOE4_55400 [Bacillus mycoides]OFD53179.1 hypothetical protein BWGOE6_56350 [Bacillus mycoides]
MTMTLLYNSPINPVKVKLNSFVQGYMHPLFTQNWQLFAPNPVSTNMDIITRGLYKDSNGKEQETEWINYTKTFTTGLQNNRFDINRLTLAGVRNAGSNVQESLSKDKSFFEKQNTKNNMNLHILYDVSRRVLIKEYGNKIDEIEIKILNTEFPEYGKKGEVKKKFVTLPTKNISTLGESNE